MIYVYSPSLGPFTDSDAEMASKADFNPLRDLIMATKVTSLEQYEAYDAKNENRPPMFGFIPSKKKKGIPQKSKKKKGVNNEEMVKKDPFEWKDGAQDLFAPGILKLSKLKPNIMGKKPPEWYYVDKVNGKTMRQNIEMAKRKERERKDRLAGSFRESLDFESQLSSPEEKEKEEKEEREREEVREIHEGDATSSRTESQSSNSQSSPQYQTTGPNFGQLHEPSPEAQESVVGGEEKGHVEETNETEEEEEQQESHPSPIAMFTGSFS